MSIMGGKFRTITEGHGGTYTIRQEDDIILIGTSGCDTCVGVCLPIDEERCFVAHINAFLFHMIETEVSSEDPAEAPKKVHERQYIRMNISPEEGARLAEEVYTQLAKHAEEENWTAQDVQESIQDPHHEIVIVCPRLHDKEGRSGKFVIEGIEKFLEMSVQKSVYKDAEGFVRSNLSGRTDIIGRGKKKEKFEDMDGIEEVKEFKMSTGGERLRGDWNISARRRTTIGGKSLWSDVLALSKK